MDAAADDWVKMRTEAMKKDGDSGPAVRTLAYNPLADGSDPGVRMIFRLRPEGWLMTTYYPSGAPGTDNQRLEIARDSAQ